MDRQQTLIQGIARITAILAKRNIGDRVPIWNGTGDESYESAANRREVFSLELEGRPIPICAGSAIVRDGTKIIVPDGAYD